MLTQRGGTGAWVTVRERNRETKEEKMATIDKSVKFKAGGKEYAVCYPLKASWEPNRNCPGTACLRPWPWQA